MISIISYDEVSRLISEATGVKITFEFRGENNSVVVRYSEVPVPMKVSIHGVKGDSLLVDYSVSKKESENETINFLKDIGTTAVNRFILSPLLNRLVNVPGVRILEYEQIVVNLHEIKSLEKFMEHFILQGMGCNDQGFIIEGLISYISKERL